ncbi:MAG: DNA mismatch repair endonuclease MutL [Bacteroidota bacterium]|nr:DNA mismatch repair endonuclease MutL [Bacteroidota bacterium]
MKDIIHLLPDNVANQIAAGEVVQRPASVVKELLENSIDAKATEINLIIKNAGKTLIQVVDNGIGMSSNDASICFERHTTSKIKSAKDLFNIRSKGFRGEALASIAAVSHTELITRQSGSDLGKIVRVKGNKIVENKSIVSKIGTSIMVKNLFYNIPARRNFLKSDNVELKHVINEFHRTSIAHPEIKFIFHSNDSELFNLPKSNLRKRIVNIFGVKSNEKLVPVSEETDILKINGFVFKPEYSKKSRGEQFFFVNNRFIKSPYLNHSVNSAFEGLIDVKYNPSYFLFMEVDPKSIDINIHPTKTEIKFDDEHSIYAILRSSIKHSLGQFNIAPILDFNHDKAMELPYSYKNKKEVKGVGIDINENYNPFVNSKVKSSENVYLDIDLEKNVQIEENSSVNTIEFNDDAIFESISVYQLNNKYLVNKIKSGIVIVNQNRAHQRILYEKFLKFITVDGSKPQKLVNPLKINLSIQEIDILVSYKKQLKSSGFVFKKASGNDLNFEAIPTFLDPNRVGEYIQDLLDNIKDEIPDKNFSQSDLTAKLMAKSLAIKTGKKLLPEEQEYIINSLFACKEPNVSPFNKKIYHTITFDEIEKKFL